MEEYGLGPNDWLEERLNELGKDAFDLLGRTNPDSLENIVGKMAKSGFRRSIALYISVLLLSLRTILPHINVLSKIDLIAQYGWVQDLPYLENALSTTTPRFDMAVISLIKDYSLVGFRTLAVEDKNLMIHLARAIDRATGHVFVPPPDSKQPPGTVEPTDASAAARPNSYALFSSALARMRGLRTISATREGEAVRDEAARAGNIRERKPPEDVDTSNA
ncbi:hypothetical protein B0H16DRAFT_1603929 [Mycena metata]|uniref:GPN-loop GTPase 2 n=1 Tax=Mycena metata TaxID=1033252 RepID=A0AAD7MKQ1_9AGAR|nr:hypothetical protein B0H16DRAFT_1603929 [Mycena metata]